MSAGAASRPAPGALSALLAELAKAPERDLCEAWDRGLGPGNVIDRFELVRELGRGGFGIVFEAVDRELGRHVAFKAIRPGARDRTSAAEELLRREAEAAAQLQHQNIVTLFDVGRCESGPYLILELLRGETLAERLARGPVPPREAVRIASEIASALVHAHGSTVLHRDLKPSNVFLTAGGGTKVLDFGLAHLLGASDPARGGTPGYMPPEQVRGEAQDARTDVFAVGVLLWEMISGARLTRREDPGATAPRLDAPGVPPALSALVASALESDPTRRPRDARALLEGLAAAERSFGAKRRGQRRVATWVTFAAALALAAAAGVLWQGTRSRAPGRTVVAVADLTNATSDPDLDVLSGMLVTSLEQSRRLSVVPRQRLLDLATPRGRPRPTHLDEAAAREAAARAGAGALLVPLARSHGGAYALELRGVEPLRGKELFFLREEGPDAASLPALIDRLSDRARQALQESDTDRGASRVRVGEALTSNLEAYRHYFAGEQCAAHPIYGQDCGTELRRAVALDPGFTAAWYELASWARHFGGSLAEQQAAITAALRNADRAPEKGRTLIRAWAAHLGGRDDEALSLFRRAAEGWPDDPRTSYQLADHLLHRDEWEAAVPWFERAITLDPEFGWALAHYVDAIGVLGRRDALQTWATRWEEAPSPATMHALSLARGWLGDMPAAAAAARRAIDMGLGVGAGEDLLAAQIFSGAYVEAEHQARALAGRGSSVRPVGYYALAALEAYQGRRRAGLAHLDALRREIPSISASPLTRSDPLPLG